MDLNKAPEDVMKDRWYTTNLENIDSVLGMSPINSYSPLEETIKNTPKFGRRNRNIENNVYTNLSTNEVKKVQQELRKQIDLLTKGVKNNNYFNSYNEFTGINDGYLYNMNTISKAIRKNKSTNLFTVDKSKLPASFRQPFETASGDMVNGLMIVDIVEQNLNKTQTINNMVDENAIDKENGI
jgi:hypothetical protein